MTISSTSNKAQFSGSGTTGPFPFSFKVFDSGDLTVVKTVSGTDTTLTITTHYTVSLNADQNTNPGGSVTLLSALAVGQTLTVLREVDASQETDITNGGGFYPEVIENALDKLTMLSQQNAEKISRALVAGVTEDPQAFIQSLYDAEANASASAASASGSASSASASASTATTQADVATVQAGNAAASAASAASIATGIQTQSAVRFTAGGTADAITGTLSPVIASYTAGLRVTATPSGANTVTEPTLNLNSLGAKTVKKRDSSGTKVALAAGDYNASGPFDFEYDGTDFILLNPLPAAVVSNTSVPVRQTVLSGPVDSNGFAAFGGSTGSTTVTASGTLKATAAAGGDANYTGSIVNPSWTGLSTNGTMYLYLDITSGGVVTTGSTTLAPVYQWGGTYSTTNLQNTFNIQEMTMKVGNGSTASQVYRVFVGEVTVAGGVVTAITWYALMGRYKSADVACTATASTTTFSHKLGTPDADMTLFLRCGTAQANINVGDVVKNIGIQSGSAYIAMQARQTDRKTAKVTTGSSAAYVVVDGSTGGGTSITIANFTQFLVVNRGW